MIMRNFPYSGRTFLVDYGELAATNAYSADGKALTYEITSGPFAGATATVEFEWTQVGDGIYVISWQEADGATVVHVDDFSLGSSLSFFTTSTAQFYRLSGTLIQLNGTRKP